jgi:hypothetical protein
MISRIKTLSLLCALVALQAIGISAAHASQYTGSAYPSTATSQSTAGSKTFTTPGGTVQCDSHGQSTLNAASSTATITPKYTNCKAFGFLNATVNMNGCTYVSHAGAQVSPGVYNNSTDISCPAGQSISITAGTCVIRISAQTGLSTIKTTNLAAGTVTVQPNITNITHAVITDGFGCPFPGTGHYTGTYHGDSVSARVGGGTISVSGV